jgi:hypothetical protein
VEAGCGGGGLEVGCGGGGVKKRFSRDGGGDRILQRRRRRPYTAATAAANVQCVEDGGGFVSYWSKRVRSDWGLSEGFVNSRRVSTLLFYWANPVRRAPLSKCARNEIYGAKLPGSGARRGK